MAGRGEHASGAVGQRLLATALALVLAVITGSATASAAPAGMHLITLGTRSGPNPTVGRAQNSNLLIANGSYYLIDAGDGVVRRLTRAGVRIRDIGTIFITHAHSDHTGGLPSLLQVQFDSNRTKKVEIYGPPGTDILTRAIMAYLNVNSDIRTSEGTQTQPVRDMVVSHDAGTGEVYRDANVVVTAVENAHFHFAPGTPAYGRFKSYAYRFEGAGRAIVLTGDTGPSEAVTRLAKGADLLVSEVNNPEEAKQRRVRNGDWQQLSPAEQNAFLRHMTEEHLTPDEVGKMAQRAGVKKVVLTHILATSDPNDDYARYAAGVRKYFGGEVVIARDLMEF